MKRTVAFFLLSAILLIAPIPAISASESPEAAIYQVSTMTELKQGRYEGGPTYAELKRHGDFGIGTLAGLDGEMIALDGRFFQIKTDGLAYSIGDAATAPFATVTFFKDADKLPRTEVKDMRELASALDRMVPDGRRIYAFMVRGDFPLIKVRSVPKQTKPFPTLEAALKNQVVFELKNVRGTMVGFRFPAFMEGVNAVGYHFHFITDDRSRGGHVLDCAAAADDVKAMPVSDFRMKLLNGPNGGRADPGR
ncbi:MAG: acetolactate decarboxylase [Pseudomonadota bacterium]